MPEGGKHRGAQAFRREASAAGPLPSPVAQVIVRTDGAEEELGKRLGSLLKARQGCFDLYVLQLD